jgi:hypothetical protein
MPSTPTRDLPEEFLAATRKSQEVAIRAIKTWVETVRTVTPRLPSVYGPLTDRLPRLPSVTVPFADKLPKPEDVVASSYDFAEHLLAIQRKFAEDVLAATEPLIRPNGKRTWQDVTRKDAAAADREDGRGREDHRDRNRPGDREGLDCLRPRRPRQAVTQVAPKPATQVAPNPQRPRWPRSRPPRSPRAHRRP